MSENRLENDLKRDIRSFLEQKNQLVELDRQFNNFTRNRENIEISLKTIKERLLSYVGINIPRKVLLFNDKLIVIDYNKQTIEFEDVSNLT